MIPLNAKQLINRCIDLGIHLSNGENGMLHCVSPAGAMTDDLRRALRENKAEIIATINGEHPDRPAAITIKAIETHYNGYRFRSRLEARWAVFFDALGIRWEYEPEGYVLPDGVRYLPDFWLPTFCGGMFAEVKPEGGDFTKAKALALAAGKLVWLCEGLPFPREYTIVEPVHDCDHCQSWKSRCDTEWDGTVLPECSGCTKIADVYECEGIPNFDQAEGEDRMFWSPGYCYEDHSIPEDYLKHCDGRLTLLLAAVNAARSARFGD